MMTPSPDSRIIRPAVEAELAALSALCLRSKAWWGYDAAFMAACRDELTLRPRDLTETSVVAAECGSSLVGVAQVAVDGPDCDLLKLFVDPGEMGCGRGAALFRWAAQEGRRLGAGRMTIEADPDAVPFYRRMGAMVTGEAPSGSIPGRFLPMLELQLTE